MEITMASYSNNFVNLIIRPAGRSRSFKWLGRGNIDKIPHIPRPIFIPRWIPKERPEYVAKWVPTTPGPQSIKQSSQQSGYGTPKTNTVTQKQKLPLKHDIAPAKAPAALALPPPTAKAPAALPLHPAKAPATPIQLPPPPPINNHVSMPSHNLVAPPTGYNSPLAEDIISLPQNNGLPPTTVAQYIPPVPVITQPPVPQPNNIIPETAIRNTFTNSVSDFLGEPNFSALIQDPQVVDISGFSQVNPASVITSDQGSIGTIGNVINVGSDIIVTEDSVRFSNPEVNTSPNLPASDTFFLNNANDALPADLSFDDFTDINQDDILFVVDPDSTLAPLTTTPFLFNEDTNLQSLQDNSGKSFNAPIISQTVDPIQSSIVSHQNTDTLFIEDVTAHISQPNVVTKLNNGVSPNENLLVTQSPQFVEKSQTTLNFQPDVNFQPSVNAEANGGFQPNENFQTNGALQLNQGFQPNESLEFIIDSGSNEDFQELKDSVLLSPQVLEPQQNIQADNDNDLFLVDTEIKPTITEFQSDQEAQFSSNFQLGQRINLRPLPIQQHNTGVGRASFPPSLPRPALVAPPASPVLASERSDNVAPVVPSGRSFSTNMVIPQPVPIPLGPLASVTLDFPKEGPGVRQARVASGLLPFGSRLHPRLTRRYQSRRSFTFGK